MSCDICDILKNKEIFNFIYEDELCFAILHENPSFPGHCLVIPKEHVPILEELDDKITEHLLIIANKVSTAIFETIGAHGTNIVLNNGLDSGQELPHLVLNVIPRKDKDGINFEWPPKKIANDALKAIQTKIKIFSDAIFSGKDKLPSAKIKHDEHDSGSHDAHGQEQHTKPHDSHGHEAAHEKKHGPDTHGHAEDHGVKKHDPHDSHGHSSHETKGEDYLTKNLIRPA